MRILENENGWITAVIEGRWVSAKMYDMPSIYHLQHSRIAKLFISKEDKCDPQKLFFAQMCYSYDKGVEFDEAPAGMVEDIVRQLESLPLIY